MQLAYSTLPTEKAGGRIQADQITALQKLVEILRSVGRGKKICFHVDFSENNFVWKTQK